MISQKEVGYIPQRLGLVKHSTVSHTRTRKPRWYPAVLPLGSDLNSDVDSALTSLGIEVFSENPVRILSGGQQRRVAIESACSKAKIDFG